MLESYAGLRPLDFEVSAFWAYVPPQSTLRYSFSDWLRETRPCLCVYRFIRAWDRERNHSGF